MPFLMDTSAQFLFAVSQLFVAVICDACVALTAGPNPAVTAAVPKKMVATRTDFLMCGPFLILTAGCGLPSGHVHAATVPHRGRIVTVTTADTCGPLLVVCSGLSCCGHGAGAASRTSRRVPGRFHDTARSRPISPVVRVDQRAVADDEDAGRQRGAGAECRPAYTVCDRLRSAVSRRFRPTLSTLMESVPPDS